MDPSQSSIAFTLNGPLDYIMLWLAESTDWAVKIYPDVTQTFIKITDLLVAISIPASIFFLIMIVYTVERLKWVRKQEEAIFDAKVEPAYEDVKTKGDPALAHRWEDVKKHINSDNINDWKQAIMEADIILDDLLTNIGYRGESIGEKLKRVEPAHFETLNEAWEAHRMRNAIAHEGSTFTMNHLEAKRIIQLYRKVFEEFYYI